jgi:hypothetical protein
METCCADRKIRIREQYHERTKTSCTQTQPPSHPKNKEHIHSQHGQRRSARFLNLTMQLRGPAVEEDDVDNVPVFLGLLLLNVVIKAGYMLVVYYNLPDRRWPTRAVKPLYRYGRFDRHNRVHRKTFTAAGVFRDISSSHFML